MRQGHHLPLLATPAATIQAPRPINADDQNAQDSPLRTEHTDFDDQSSAYDPQHWLDQRWCLEVVVFPR